MRCENILQKFGTCFADSCTGGLGDCYEVASNKPQPSESTAYYLLMDPGLFARRLNTVLLVQSYRWAFQ